MRLATRSFGIATLLTVRPVAARALTRTRTRTLALTVTATGTVTMSVTVTVTLTLTRCASPLGAPVGQVYVSSSDDGGASWLPSSARFVFYDLSRPHIPPLYLPCTSPISPLYLPAHLPHISPPRWCSASEAPLRSSTCYGW